MENQEPSKRVTVCQGSCCRRQGAAAVLAAFKKLLLQDNITIASGCLGQCGNGPMILVEPEMIWYSRVHPDEVPAVVKRHLRGGQPIAAMLYAKFHPNYYLK
ncbi:MAG: (2Fe-2S) ferredoxin domain-containing protein [Symploca sp. SIO3C6]|uniref:(2Fe-2S) ferredoxin domain-containing protein n=1 Tax=Symploca sp. SIO1C4 TaxID=2607765 RepID=A0A6B3N356_9CYAN|nr:(2Fe-2S) ferredoxin domain-containing protein [Symploca sp. SIO3C6]NER27609.1 (2Fe-2S) ferredoxin domain-containing protein [Symploca sp. SIO1C4]NET03807.1 (2Fe-2S) ferredoxin domain-containing protein [Symploca sp. SIO2B6]NET51589.1 (2Fe-2S) ferredoxin domain-containing protein [Merismopedia sp. SIO2A8]